LILLPYFEIEAGEGNRTHGSMLNARKPGQLLAEAAFKVLAYTLRR